MSVMAELRYCDYYSQMSLADFLRFQADVRSGAASAASNEISTHRSEA